MSSEIAINTKIAFQLTHVIQYEMIHKRYMTQKSNDAQLSYKKKNQNDNGAMRIRCTVLIFLR